jgi:aminopeptidase YwaD
MDLQSLSETAAGYLQTLCTGILTRAVGSAGNRRATEFFADRLRASGFQVETPEFDCIDWIETGAELAVGADRFEIFPSPYANGGEARSPLAVVSTVSQLENADLAGRILLLRGEIAREPLMPKNFPFYNPAEHRQIYRLLERKQPAVILTAAARSPELAGAIYPLPMIEDGDFDIPSAYLSEEEGSRLAGYGGQEAHAAIRARRIPARGCNVVGRKGPDAGPRVVVCAHIDAKAGTPGALDNAAGISVLLLLAGLLADQAVPVGVEIVAINGEDYYSSPGEMEWLRRSQATLKSIRLGINLDGVGYRAGRTAFSLYECPAKLGETLRAHFAGRPGFVEGEPWYQGDHMLFLMNGVPALAFTSERVLELMARYVHTADDRPEIVDPQKLVETAVAIYELITRPGI